MPNYIVLINWRTGQYKSAKSFEGAIEKAGGRSLGIYYTIWRYDNVAIVEAPNGEAIALGLYAPEP